jgi:hypothetical protein
MDLKLHANATTTPRIRAYIQKSTASTSALARELGVHSRTVARERPPGGERSLHASVSAGHHDDALGGSSGRRAAPQPRPAARRCRRSHAALPQSAIVARHPSLPQTARTVRPPHPAEGTGRRLPHRCPGRLHPHRRQIPAAAGRPKTSRGSVICATPDVSSRERVLLFRDRSSLRLGLAATVKADRDAARKRGTGRPPPAGPRRRPNSTRARSRR